MTNEKSTGRNLLISLFVPHGSRFKVSYLSMYPKALEDDLKKSGVLAEQQTNQRAFNFKN